MTVFPSLSSRTQVIVWSLGNYSQLLLHLFTSLLLSGHGELLNTLLFRVLICKMGTKAILLKLF